MKPVALVLVLGIAVAGCGRLSESRFNPFTWFGGDRDSTAVAAPTTPDDPRPIVDQVIALSVEPTPDGAVIRAVGLPSTQGHWNAALVPDTRASPAGVLSYTFRVVPPTGTPRVSTPQSREIVAAVFVRSERLRDVREIRVLGRQGSRLVRR